MPFTPPGGRGGSGGGAAGTEAAFAGTTGVAGAAARCRHPASASSAAPAAILIVLRRVCARFESGPTGAATGGKGGTRRMFRVGYVLFMRSEIPSLYGRRAGLQRGRGPHGEDFLLLPEGERLTIAPLPKQCRERGRCGYSSIPDSPCPSKMQAFCETA